MIISKYDVRRILFFLIFFFISYLFQLNTISSRKNDSMNLQLKFKEKKREEWSGKLDFFLAALGYAGKFKN